MLTVCEVPWRNGTIAMQHAGGEMRCQHHGGGPRCRCGCVSRWHVVAKAAATKRDGCMNGDGWRLCCLCAVAAGLKAEHIPASKEACHLFCMLNAAAPAAPPIEHMHLDSMTQAWVGDEVGGLAAPRRCRPDGVQRDEHGRIFRCWLYHGCAWHGYPPDHPQHHEPLRAKGTNGELSSDAYAATMADMACYQANGYEVCYVWSVDFDAFWKVAKQRCRPSAELQSIVYTL